MLVQCRLFHNVTCQFHGTHQIGQIGRMGETLWVDQWGRVGRGVFDIDDSATKLLQSAHVIGEAVATNARRPAVILVRSGKKVMLNNGIRV